jgi:hypothetical protein
MNEKLRKIENGDKKGKIFVIKDFFDRFIDRSIDG